MYGLMILQGFSYLSEVGGLLNLGKRAFGPSNWEKLMQSKRTEKNWTAILFVLQTI